jgi:hypothetical protein
MVQGTSLAKTATLRRFSTSDRLRCSFISLLARERGVYLRISEFKLSAYGTSVLFPSASCAPGSYSQTLHHTLSRLRYEANCQGALTMPEAYWSLLGAQLCRKTDLNPEKILESLV